MMWFFSLFNFHSLKTMDNWNVSHLQTVDILITIHSVICADVSYFGSYVELDVLYVYLIIIFMLLVFSLFWQHIKLVSQMLSRHCITNSINRYEKRQAQSRNKPSSEQICIKDYVNTILSYSFLGFQQSLLLFSIRIIHVLLKITTYFLHNLTH